MTFLYKRNAQFKRDLPKYRFALRKWMWQGKADRVMTAAVQRRWEKVIVLERMIFDWQVHCFFPMNLIIEPPDALIKEVLQWC